MLPRLRNMYILGASLRPHVFHARLVPPRTILSFSTSTPRRSSTQPQAQAQTQKVQPTEPVEEKPFSSLGSFLHPNTLKAITETPYKHVSMSPVQEKVLGMMPALVDTEEGKDLLVRAKTGTGKTLAFIVPGIERRVRVLERLAEEGLGDEGEGIIGGAESNTAVLRRRMMNRLARETMGVLVISPTRELATQIAVSANNLSVHHADSGKGFGVQLLVGGESRGRQMKQWVDGRKDVVVGTPGRLRDLLEGWNWESRGSAGVQLGLKEVFGKSGNCVVVLDEADTLLDMGFRSDVESIVGNLMRGRGAEGKQTWMFSATVGRGVESIVKETMRKGNWEYVDCVGRSEEKDVHSHVRQMHTVVGDGGGMGAFVHFLRLIVHDQLSVMKRIRDGEKGVRSKMLVFFSTTKMTKLFGRLLRECVDRGMMFPMKKMRVYEMHSKKEMNERVRVSRDFRERSIAADEGVVMVSSDVSARGVDYPGVGRVVQMGIPGSREGYVHRVGRTGRGDVKEGRGDLVIAPWEMGFMKVLGDVGMEPVTVEGLKSEIEALAEELGGGELTKKVGKIEDIARSVADVSGHRVAVGEGEYRAAWASLVGFYVGNWDGMGMGGMNEVIDGSGRWMEGLGGLENGSLASGPGSGLPRGVMDRLKKDADRGGRARGGKEKAWGTWSKNRDGNQDGRRSSSWGRSDSRPGGWGSQGNNTRQSSWQERGNTTRQSSWGRDQERGNTQARQSSWGRRDQEGGSTTGQSSWGRDQGSQEEHTRPEVRRNSWGKYQAEGKQEGGRGWVDKREEGNSERKSFRSSKPTPSWMGRGSKGKKARDY